MKSIDERIHNALSSEDQAFLSRMDADGSLYRDVAATFRGHARWLNAFAIFLAFVFLGAGVFCGWRFAMEPDLRTMQFFGAGTILSFLALGLIKLWFWMEMQKIAIVREIKRVELRLASLTDALRAS